MAKNPNKTNQPKGKAYEGKATPKGVQVGKTNDPEGRQDQQQTNKHKSRMDKGPKNLLHMNQPSLHSINVTRLISNNPTKPRRQKVSRFRDTTQATRTIPSDMFKRAKLSATISSAHGRRTMRHPTTKGSRGKSGTTSQSPSFRTGGDKLTSSMPIKYDGNSQRHRESSPAEHPVAQTPCGDASTKHAKRREQRADADQCHPR